MTKEREKELLRRIQQLEDAVEHVDMINRKFALVQTEWNKYERSYKAYIAKRYRIRDWLYRLYHRLRHRKLPNRETMVARRMARVFAKGDYNEQY